MPPKRKPVKRKSLKNPVVRGTKQKQSQSQKVVVNVNTIKSKPRKKSGRGGLPPPSYQHNLAPTFVTQQATDYNPVIGAIASLTSRLQQEPRIQQPVTPLSSATQMANQQAQSMAGVKAEERREGSTAGNFQPLPSQVRTETPPEEPITSKIIFTPKEKRKKKGFKPIVKLGGDITQREADEYTTEQLVKGGGKEIPQAEVRPLRGRPPKGIQQGIPVNPLQQAQAEKPKKKPPAGQKDVDKLFKSQSKK